MIRLPCLNRHTLMNVSTQWSAIEKREVSSMEELLQDLQADIILGELLAELGWYTALTDHWYASIAPKVCQLWQMINA